MIDRVIDILRQQFGDHFVSIAVLIFFVILALRRGVFEVQTWIKHEVLEPYIAPLIARLDTTVNVQHGHTELLVDHESRLRHNERVNRILQGKVLGGSIHLGDEEEED